MSMQVKVLKGHLARKLKELHPDIPVCDLEELVEIVFRAITEALENGRRVEIRGFGSFCLHRQKGKVFKNPRTGVTVNCPSSFRVSFKPGKDLKIRME